MRSADGAPAIAAPAAFTLNNVPSPAITWTHSGVVSTMARKLASLCLSASSVRLRSSMSVSRVRWAAYAH